MSDQAALLRAVCDRPDDDAPRLVYADWLDEHGQPERAEFIRVQCSLARFRRPDFERFQAALPADALRQEHRRALLAPLEALGLPECVSRYHYGEKCGFAFYLRRGFVEDLQVFGAPAAERLAGAARLLFEQAPLRHVWILPHSCTDTEGYDEDVLPIPLPALQALVQVPGVGRLRSLDLTAHSLGDAGARALLDSPHLTRHIQLFLAGNGFSPEFNKRLQARFGDVFAWLPADPGAWDFYSPGDEVPF